jgi:hypothetical protein
VSDSLRYLPERLFPPYAFLPGRDPHPTRDPRGHSYSEVEGPGGSHTPAEQWQENKGYLFGCDLYNSGYLWEAHEAWEDIWHPSKHDEVQANFLQGLIQCSAASLKIPMGQPDGLAKLSEQGTLRLEGVMQSAGPSYMGLDLAQFIAAFRAFASSSPASADERPQIELDV